MEIPAPSHLTAGAAAEDAALQFLTNRGFRPVSRNFRSPRGEVDLVMTRDDLLVFVEVRYRSRGDFGGAIASVTAGKQQKIIATARYFLHHRPRFSGHAVRFDVIALTGSPGHWDIQWIPAAFLAE
ncbi:MAG TPA: YraN family protein [Fluviicoccus sp.]|nr:YraN family protein [Fluviicoccus sp.]